MLGMIPLRQYNLERLCSRESLHGEAFMKVLLTAFVVGWLTTAATAQTDAGRTTDHSTAETGGAAPYAEYQTRGRPAVLLPLYISFGVLQVVDTVSTLEALKHGGRGANPVVAPFASNAGALYSLKVVTTVGSIWAAEKLWKRNRAAAIVTMLAVNAGYAWVAHHNYQIAGR